MHFMQHKTVPDVKSETYLLCKANMDTAYTTWLFNSPRVINKLIKAIVHINISATNFPTETVR